MRLLLLGAAGRVGSLTLQQAVASGTTVYAFARTPSKLSVPPGEHCIHIKGDATSATDVLAAFEQARPEAVVSTLGFIGGTKPGTVQTVTRNMIDACRQTGTKRLIILGGVQVLEDGDQLPFTFRAFRLLFTLLGQGAVLKEGAEMLQTLRGTGDLDWTLVRPSVFKDGPSKLESGGVSEMYAGPVAGVRGTIQKVDLARWMLAHLAVDGPWKQAAPAISN